MNKIYWIERNGETKTKGVHPLGQETFPCYPVQFILLIPSKRLRLRFPD